MGADPKSLAGADPEFSEALRVRRYPTRAEMGAAAAADVAEAIRAQISAQGHVRMVFAAAPSQAEMLNALVSNPTVDWGRVEAFHMDEYIGLPKGAPQRFANWLRDHLFEWVPLAAVYPIEPEPDPEAAARAYAARLAEAPIDMICLGIGVNGHIAFNDPPVADFGDPLDVKVVELDAVCRQQQVEDACFARLDDVPRSAITLTVPRLMRADRLFCVVPGRAKREAVRNALTGPVTTACPASILRRHPDCTFYLDTESAP